MKSFAPLLSISLLLCVAAPAGAEAPAASKPAADNTQSPADKAQPTPDEQRRARVVATIGTEKLTVGEVEDAIAARSPFIRKRFQEEEGLRAFVEEQIKAMLLAQAAEKAALDQRPDVVRLVSEQMVQLFLRSEFEDKVTPASISDEEVAAYYKENQASYRQPEMRRASHIVVADKSAALALIQKAKGLKPQEFSELAKTESIDDETKQRGGDLLYFTEDGNPMGGRDAPVAAPLVKATFALKKTGDVVSKPIDLGNGKWSVLRVTAIRQGRERKLADAAQGIRRKLWREKRKAELDQLLAKLQEELKPETHPDRLDAIKLPALPPNMPAPGHGGGMTLPNPPPAGDDQSGDEQP